MSVAMTIGVNDDDIANANRTLERHRRRLYPDTRPGGVARCQVDGQPWPCVRARLGMQVLGVARSDDRAVVGAEAR